MPKPKSNSKLDRLPPQRKANLEYWLFDLNESLADIRAKLLAEDGLSTSERALSEWRKRREPLRDLRRSAQAAEDLTAEVRAASPTLDESFLGLVSQKAFDLAIQKQTDIPGVVGLARIILQARQQTTDRAALDLSREKFQWSAADACRRLAPEIQAVVKRTDLTNEQQITEIQRLLFGEPVAADVQSAPSA